MRILLVEDDITLGAAVVDALTYSGLAVECVQTAASATHMLDVEHFDLLVLDLGLPDRDGLTVIKHARRTEKLLPILVLTAHDAVESRVKSLDLGADDYLVKPAAMAELCARVRALLRRGKGGMPCFTIGDLELDTIGKIAMVHKKKLDLSAREWGVLEYLALYTDKIISKEQLIQSMTNMEQDLSANAIEAYVHRLRIKLVNSGVTIRTVRGLGYMLNENKS